MDNVPAQPPPTPLDYQGVPAPDYPSPPARDPYAALRFESFILYASGWMVAVVGEQIMEVAVGWDVYQHTHSMMSLGWVGLIAGLPVIVMALPAGHLADRLDRRRIVLCTQLVIAACAVGLMLASRQHASIGVLYGLIGLMATAKATGGPARSSLLPMLVPESCYGNAVTWNSSGFQLAAMTGPALGGLIVAASVPLAYLIAGLCVASLGINVAFLKLRSAPRKKEPATIKSLVAGVRFVFSTKIILATITLDLFAVLLGGATYLLPRFADDILHCGPRGFGWLRAAPAIGAIIMAMAVAHLPPMKKAGRTMLWAVAGFGLATIVFGLSHSFWLSFAMLLLTGAFDNISVVVRHTLVQVLTPDAMRGRVSAVNNVFIGASNELGGFESGLTGNLFGAVTSVVAGGIGTIIVVILVALSFPDILSFGSLADAKPAEDKRGET